MTMRSWDSGEKNHSIWGHFGPRWKVRLESSFMKWGCVSLGTTPCRVMPLSDAAISCNFLCEKVATVKSNQMHSKQSKANFEENIRQCSDQRGKNIFICLQWYSTTDNLREEDEVTDTDTDAWWTWDPGFPELPWTRHTYSPESSGVAARIRSWLPRTWKQQGGSRVPSVLFISYKFISTFSDAVIFSVWIRMKRKSWVCWERNPLLCQHVRPSNQTFAN